MKRRINQVAAFVIALLLALMPLSLAEEVAMENDTIIMAEGNETTNETSQYCESNTNDMNTTS